MRDMWQRRIARMRGPECLWLPPVVERPSGVWLGLPAVKRKQSRRRRVATDRRTTLAQERPRAAGGTARVRSFRLTTALTFAGPSAMFNDRRSLPISGTPSGGKGRADSERLGAPSTQSTQPGWSGSDVLRALQQHASAGEAEHPGVVNTQHGCMLTSIASMTLVRVNNPPQQDRDVRSPQFAMDPRGVHTLPSRYQ